MPGAHSEIYEDGFNCYCRNPDQYHNPYPAGTPDFNDFERGWTQALKRDTRRRPPGLKKGPVWSHKVAKPHGLSPEQEAVRAAYKKLK